ncbi:origin recognition complex subunit 6 [Toxorhynchites rutilus septentrionalis]|uniref:origin recognition complex subunit 6 n=1 Tax=Toxorhynchites rutilus septentrionalis TaxID=329112 RepID=UPI002479E6C4|nr:origin recognition complex subunit 6 [Toxorhynchites rutilus septentrionalis]
MANIENKLLIQMILKLGLTEHEQLEPKSTELLRLLQLKSAGGVANLGDYAKATICIDLATGLLGLPFHNETALKLSGLKKSAYANSKRTLEKILDINKIIGINEICIQLGLNQVQEEATKLLDSYKRFTGNGNVEVDFAHPQYATMAVFQACKRQKVKPPKAKLVSYSHLKPAQWTLLEKNWEKFLSSAADLSAASKSKDNKAIEADNPTEERLIVDERVSGHKHSSPEKIEPYVNWKKRMLEKAYRELRALQQER